MPLFAIVRPKRRGLVIAPLGALQGLSNFPIIGNSDSLKGYFSLELPPSQNELSPVHRRLLPLCSNAALHLSSIGSGNAGKVRQVPRNPARKTSRRSHAPFFLRSIRGSHGRVDRFRESGRRVSRTAGSLYPRQRGCIGGQLRKKDEFAIIHRVADNHPELRPLRAASGMIGLGQLGAHPLLMSYFPANEPVRHAPRPVAIYCPMLGENSFPPLSRTGRARGDKSLGYMMRLLDNPCCRSAPLTLRMSLAARKLAS